MLERDFSAVYSVMGNEIIEPVNLITDSSINKKLRSAHKREVLIIEDSTAVSLVIHRFLKKMGYENIYTCTNGTTALKIFRELTEISKTPVVFLDYSLPDMPAIEILERIFNTSPGAKIIIETANERTDPLIKEILRHGVFEYLEKPIRYENVEKIMQEIEKEESIVEENQPDYSFDTHW